MDWLAAYYTGLSTILAIFILILLPLILYSLIFSPDYIEAEFRAPKGYRESGTRIINVLAHPADKDLAFLLVVFVVDILLIYPYTLSGSQSDISSISKIGGTIILEIQLMAAVGWCGIQSDWIAGSRNFGLWKISSWAGYYMAFILTTFACAGPVAFVGMKLGTGWVISHTPNVWMALYHAFRPLIPI